MFLKRIVCCAGQVGPEMANNLVAQLLYLDAVDPNKVCFTIFLFKLLFLCELAAAYLDAECFLLFLFDIIFSLFLCDTLFFCWYLAIHFDL